MDILKGILGPIAYLLGYFIIVGISIHFKLPRITFTITHSVLFCLCLYFFGLINKYLASALLLFAASIYIIQRIQGNSIVEAFNGQSGQLSKQFDLFWVFLFSAIFVFLASILKKKHSNQTIKVEEMTDGGSR